MNHDTRALQSFLSSLRIVRVMKCSGRGGYPSVRYVWHLHARHEPGGPLLPVLRRSGTPRVFRSADRARAAIRRLRAAE